MARDTDPTYYHEWDELAEHWITDEESFDKDFPTKPFDAGSGTYSSVAEWIIEIIFGLKTAADVRGRGSRLPGYDIKSRDAYQMIQLSLATELINKHLAECYADGSGLVHFYYIGENRSKISSNDIFYQINTTTLSKPCDNVLVTGYDPPPKQFVPSKGSFNLLKFFSVMPEDSSPTVSTLLRDDADKALYPIIYTWGDVLGPDACDYYKEGYIEYGDVSVDQELVLQKMGYLDKTKFDTVSTYIYKITVPGFQQASTVVKFASTTPRFVELVDGAGKGAVPTLGVLQGGDWISQDKYVAELCRAKGSKPDMNNGVRLPRSNDKKFMGVKDVYIFGYKLKQIQLDMYRDGTSLKKTEGSDLLVDLDTKLREPFRLSRGQDYIIVAEEEVKEGKPVFNRIIFASNVHPDYTNLYGGTLGKPAAGATGKIRISPASIYVDGNTVVRADMYSLNPKVSGVLKDTKSSVDNQTRTPVLIFPIGDGRTGYVVDKVIVIYDWDNPCIAVYGENNEVKKSFLESITVDVFPMVTRDEKAPIAWNNGGSTKLLDPMEIIPDPDATTVEDLDSTEYARAFTSLETGDVKITLPFLDAEDCIGVASFIYDMQNEKIEQTTYTCSPEAEPVLGELIDNKTINSIDYSYQDSSQYLISINAGPRWAGVSGWDTAVYQNKTERIQREGIVTNIYPNNIKCQVMIDDIGVMDCINSSKEILEKGDRVAITIHNNPVAK